MQALSRERQKGTKNILTVFFDTNQPLNHTSISFGGNFYGIITNFFGCLKQNDTFVKKF